MLLGIQSNFCNSCHSILHALGLIPRNVSYHHSTYLSSFFYFFVLVKKFYGTLLIFGMFIIKFEPYVTFGCGFFLFAGPISLLVKLVCFLML